MDTLDLHGLNKEQARERLIECLEGAVRHQTSVVRIIHGQGKHSQDFPVIKSMVRRWLEESDFARTHVESVFRGEDGSPYTRPNPGETIVRLRSEREVSHQNLEVDWEVEEAWEARKNAKGIRADRLRKVRRR